MSSHVDFSSAVPARLPKWSVLKHWGCCSQCRTLENISNGMFSFTYFTYPFYLFILFYSVLFTLAEASAFEQPLKNAIMYPSHVRCQLINPLPGKANGFVKSRLPRMPVETWGMKFPLNLTWRWASASTIWRPKCRGCLPAFNKGNNGPGWLGLLRLNVPAKSQDTAMFLPVSRKGGKVHCEWHWRRRMFSLCASGMIKACYLYP